MIRLRRVRDPASIPAAFRGAGRIGKALLLLVEQGDEREFDSGYWKGAKPQLRAESERKCAYCEAPTSTVAHGDVEHFRPKSHYWWLAYCYDNYLFSCQICNQSFKKDHFPLADEAKRLAGPVVAAGATGPEREELVRRFAPDPLEEGGGQPWKEFDDACRGEAPLLPNPYQDDVETLFAWEADPALKEVAVRPRTPAVEPQCEAAVRFYGLNRPELLSERWKTFRTLRTIARAYRSDQFDPVLRDEAGDVLREMMAPDAAFAGMCRYFVRVEWGLPL